MKFVYRKILAHLKMSYQVIALKLFNLEYLLGI